MLVALVALFTVTMGAQTKVGTVDADFILSKMPELVDANEALKNYNLDLESQLKTKLTTYETTLKAAQDAIATMTDAQKEAKQKELRELEDDITKFRDNGAQLLQLKQSEVVQPLYTKIAEVVSVVAKEQKYTQILNVGNNNNLAYIDPAFDITVAVMTKMGIKVE